MTAAVAPLWQPSDEVIAGSRIDAFRRFVEERSGVVLADSHALHTWSVEQPGEFWDAVWDFFGVVGEKGGIVTEPATLPAAVFFPEARLNLAENILREIPERDAPGFPLVVFTSESGGDLTVTAELTRDLLLDEVASTAAALRDRGVRAGDRIAIVLPVSQAAYVVTLAALSIGAVVSSAAPEFGVPAIVDRFGQLDPVLLVATTSYHWAGKRFDRREHLVELARALPTLRSVLVVPGSDDLSSPVDPDVLDVTKIAALIAAGSGRALRVDSLAAAQAAHEGAPMEFERLPLDHPAYVLFSSGTTGKPKCLIHRQGGVLIKHLVEAGLHGDAGPGDTAVDDGPLREVNVLSRNKFVLFPIVDRTSATESAQGTSTVDVLVGGNWWAFGNSNVPSIVDLQQVLGGDIRTVNEC